MLFRFLFFPAFAASLASVRSEPATPPPAIPLAPQAKSADEKLFDLLPPAGTGVTHAPRVHNEHKLSYMYHSGFVCGGVAVGDVDGDGKLDILFGGAAEKNHLYRGLGDFKFEDVTGKATGGIAGGERWTTGCSLIDIDGDRDLDVFLCNYESPNQLFLNDGGLKFREVAVTAGLASVDSSHSAYFCDYDRDGDLDLFLLTNKVEDPKGLAGPDRPPLNIEGGVISVKPEYERYYDFFKYDDENKGSESIGRPDLLFRNDGNGADGIPRFTDVTAAAGISGRGDGLSATWWDYDQDGWPDIYVGNDFISQDRLWHNNRDGTFTNTLPAAAPHTCWFSMGADQGDLNNDLRPDFLIADMAATTHYKSKTTMGAMGGLDLKRAVASTPPQYMRNTCLIGTGTGRFLEAAYLLGIASTDWTWAIKFADFDLDGWQDIYVTNGIIRAMNHSDFTVERSKLIDHHSWDYYKDRDPRPEQHRAYRNEQHLHFADVSTNWGLDRTAITYACAYADFDGDGDVDLVEVNLEEPPSIYRNGATGRAVVFHFKGQGGNTAGYGTKAIIETAAGRQFRQLFPQSGYHSLNEAALHFGLGADDTIKSAEITWPDGSVQTFAGLRAGQSYTFTQPEKGTPAAPAAKPSPYFVPAANFPPIRHQEKPYDDYADQILLPHALSRLGPALAWGDVNADGQPDFYVGGGADQAGELRIANGKGGFTAQWVDAFRDDKACEDMGAVFFDADGDRDLDLFVASGSYQFKRGDANLRSRLYLNDGKGNFVKAPADAIPDFRESSGPVAVADFDHDGKFDVYVGSRVVPGSYPETPRSRLLRNETSGGKVRFTDVTDDVGGKDLRLSGMVSGAVWSDVNRDGWPDLLLAHEWGKVALFMNNKGKLALRSVADDDLAKNSGWWLSVDTADMDGDGDLDIVAGNFGYNTKYKEATPQKPKLLYYADFDETGKKNIVEVKREGDKLYPERGRSCSSTAMPFLKKKFPTYDTFAKATLDEVYGDKLKEADKFEANTLGSGIFFNEGSDANGVPKFRYMALERIAQIAPSFGLVVADFDGDGLNDLMLAQNFHSPQIETGRYDGGLGQLLLNQGKRELLPIASGDSGIAIPDDAKAATACDLDGDGRQDLLVSTNGGSLKALHNRFPSDGPKVLTVILDAAGAPGALVRMEREDAPTQAAEYHAGGGYLSQNPAVFHFGLGTASAKGKVTVLWPDGSTSSADFLPGALRLKLSPGAATR
ncbi:MAG TPA: FG-GAP-like repeat-containing protein [Verrucomicrobiales bacterium]|nr:FG-GAP-like repeat-containing protein [Verrucomicrobiales bacterium]